LARPFRGDPKVIGQTVILDGNGITVVGILPPVFSFPLTNPAPEVFMPLALRAVPDRSAGALELIGRLKPGVALEQARADMETVARAVEQQYHPYRGPRGEDAGYGVTVTALRDELYGGIRRGLFVLLGAVAFVLLIACANVSNLLLARTAERRKEIAVRHALGANSLQVVRQLLIESTVLSLAGGLLGLLIAFWGIDVLQTVGAGSLSHLQRIPVDRRVLGFALLISLITGLVFGMAPALNGSIRNPGETLKECGRSTIGGKRGARLRHVLMVAEVALSLVLLIGAGLLIKSFVRLNRVNPGFRAQRLVTARISLPEDQYPENHRVIAFYRETIERVQSLPGVSSAGIVSRLPLTGGPGGDPFSIEGRPYDLHGKTPQVVNQQIVSAEYFRTMQIPLLEGRLFTTRESAPLAIINATMARGFWPGGNGKSNAIGKRIMLGAPRPGAPWLTVVGVVADVRNSSLNVQPLPQMYVPFEQTPARSMSLVVRTAVDAPTIITAVRRGIFSLDPNQPLYDVKTMQERVAATVAQPRFQTFLLSSFAALALVLAAIGIYGVIAQLVGERTHEVGIRMALGAEPHNILVSVLKEGMALGLGGVALGLCATLAVSRLLASLLYEVPPFDPPTFLGASVLLMGVVLAACYIPAHRAARLDPMAALRTE
jgi:putative ABC transport system permease protein